MKVITSLNPDYADFDEMDLDVLEAVQDWESGALSRAELIACVGRETAQKIFFKNKYEFVDYTIDKYT